MMCCIRCESVFSLLIACLQLNWIQCESIDQQPPSIIESSPKHLFFEEHDSVTLECRAIGSPEVTYQWKKDGVTITATNRHRFNDTVLEISLVTRADEGFYQCFAENMFGTAFSNFTQLQMTSLQAKGPTKSTNNVQATEGQPFSIPGSSFKVIPELISYEDYFWTKNNKRDNVTLGRRIQMDDNGNLHFAYALTTDDLKGQLYANFLSNPFTKKAAEGNYTRVTVTTGSFQDLLPTLAFASVSRNVALEGESVRLRCYFYGKPEPAITWLRSVDSLPADRFTLSNFDTELTLINITKSDETLYHCLGTNSLGSAIHNLTVTVQAAPRFVEPADGPRDAHVIEDDDAVFRCYATANPEATVEWFFNGKSLKESPRDRFIISEDQKSLSVKSVCRYCKRKDDQTVFSDTGVIQCNASNIHGYAIGSGYLNVITLKQAATLNAAITQSRPIVFDLAFIIITLVISSTCF